MSHLAPLLLSLSAAAAWQAPVLEIPEAGVDDPAAYDGYTTRFFRDARRNAFQIYLNSSDGRVVHVWADAANASAAFTVRGTDGKPAQISWDSPGVDASSVESIRTMKYRLASGRTALDIGWFLLGTMRQEREFQDQDWQLRPYGDGRFALTEFVHLLDSVEHLPAKERERHLSLLRTDELADLRRRLEFEPKISSDRGEWVVVVEHTTLDGRNQMTLELRGDLAESTARLAHGVVSLRARNRGGIRFDVIATTDNTPLTPLGRNRIFSSEFEAFLERERRAAEVGETDPLPSGAALRPEHVAYRRLEREVAGIELLSAEEKLIAALPNYATYFGRDTMMAALMLERISSVDLQEHVVANVLQKLAPSGDVSHEEAVGEQAIRENAVDYSALIEMSEQAMRGDSLAAAGYLADARALLRNLQSARENYRMIDDDFQLAVLVERYLSRADVSAWRKRAFLSEVDPNGVRHLEALVGNLALVARLARPYAERPEASNLVGFRHRDEEGYEPGSWRDSRAGYGNGRFAMDVNVVWVPAALEAMARIRQTLDELSLPISDLLPRLPDDATALRFYLENPEALRVAIATWRRARRHFEVRLDRDALRQRLDSSLATLEGEERAFWQRRVHRSGAAIPPLSFLALALDDAGIPIPAIHTDVATDLFLRNYTAEILRGELDPDAVLQPLEIVVRAYPVGLSIEGVGPVVVNDAFASEAVQQRFRADDYHSPHTVWGREVNLLLLGLARQIEAAYDRSGRLIEDSPAMRHYVQTLRHALDVSSKSVEDSGMRHNELWSYRIDGGVVRPARYGTSSDIQLWNLTDLAVRFELDRLPAPPAADRVADEAPSE